MDIKEHIGIRVQTFRKAKGLTQNQLAELTDRSVEAISNIERGRSLPGLETLIILSEKLDVPLAAFFEFQDTATSAPRARLMVELQSLAYGLNDKKLQIAVSQVRALKAGAGESS